MQLHWVGLVLIAAILHATWNALVKVSGDRLVILSSVSAGQAVVGLLAVPFVGFPSAEVWPLILLSAGLHYLYCVFIYQAYRLGDLSQVYPVTRGSAPILVALGAFLSIGEVPSRNELFGIGLICLGILMLAVVKKGSSKRDVSSMLFALGTGATIAAYTVSDGTGARLSANAITYIVWLFVFELPIVGFAALVRRKQMVIAMRAEYGKFVGSAISSTLAYGLVIVASVHAPLALVSALRETSVVIAAVIGVTLLHERPWLRRISAAAIVVIGILRLAIV